LSRLSGQVVAGAVGARSIDPPARPAAAAGLGDVDFRPAMIRLGLLVGWAAILAVLVGLSLDVGATHRGFLLALTLLAATGNTLAMFVPWRDWLGQVRGRLLLDLWSGALLGFVALLVIAGGANFALLMFLVSPFLAVVHVGRRRPAWLSVAGGTCLLVAAIAGLPAGATAMRMALLAAAAAATLVLARTLRREASGHREAAERADLERALAAEANHRIKNNLQTVADLLLLGRPEDRDGRAFDETAARIQSIAALHGLLAENGGPAVEAHGLLASIADTAPVPVAVEAERVTFDSSTAQKVGLIANELITNAFQHGAPPIAVRLSAGRQILLRVDDGGAGSERPNGLGLQLVRRIVEQGLGGRFELAARPGGGTRAEVVFPREPS
jgi:two-component sensor histidine kinase